MSTFGRNLAKARTERGMSAATLSLKCDGQPTRSVIANWESGRKHDVTVSELVRLSRVLGVTPADLCPELDFGRDERAESAKRILRDAISTALNELETQ